MISIKSTWADGLPRRPTHSSVRTPESFLRHQRATPNGCHPSSGPVPSFTKISIGFGRTLQGWLKFQRERRPQELPNAAGGCVSHPRTLLPESWVEHWARLSENRRPCLCNSAAHNYKARRGPKLSRGRQPSLAPHSVQYSDWTHNTIS